MVFLFFAYQSILYYAACYGNLRFVKYLVNVSPMALFLPALPPIVGSIENRFFEITSFLLSRGADPNAPIPINYLQSMNSKESNSKIMIRPLDIAISKKDGRSVSTLITCGADVGLVDQTKLRPSIKTQLDKYRGGKISEDLDIKNKLSDLQNQINSYSEANETIINEMKKIVDYRSEEISPIINKIRKHYLLSSELVTLIMNIVENIQKRRQTLLDSQFNLLVEDDKNIFQQGFEDDNKEWENLYKNTTEKLKQKANSTTSEAVRQFCSRCIREIESQLNQFKQNSKQVLSPLRISSNYSKSVGQDQLTSNASRLLSLNYVYQELKRKMETVFNLLYEFHTKSLQTVNGFLNIMNQYMDTINEISKSNQDNLFNRLGFSKSIIETIEDENGERKSIVEQTQSKLDEQKKNFTELYALMKHYIFKYLT